jgi:hypothetical protein
VYRVNPSRVSGARFLVGFLVFMALAFVGIAYYFGTNPKQINKPFVVLLCAGFAAMWLGLAVLIIYRLGVYGKQRVLLYPEGIVAWVKGEPRAYPWDKLRSVTCKRKLVTQGFLERWAYVGKDLEYTVCFENEEPLIVNAMLKRIEELGEQLTQRSQPQDESGKQE